eukprot:2576280-Pyramimonas_sp.AAC.1
MAQFETPTGETPRRVQIERKKRLFAQQDISRLLEQKGINSFVNQPSGLELAFFDDQEFDTRTFDEWVDKEALEQGVQCKVACYPELPGPPSWELGQICSGNAANNTYTCQLSTGKMVEVPRIDVYFLAEDPFNFVERRVHAHTLRQDTESTLLYNLFVDSMPTEDIPPLTVEQVGPR